VKDEALLAPWRVCLALSFWVGASVGSFLNVVHWRLPRGRSVVSPPSACPRCGGRIRPWHNIPVVGWLLLRGRCHDCALPIAARYPLVEALCGVLWCLVYLRLLPGPTSLLEPGRLALLPLWGAWVSGLLVISLIDADHRIIPPALSLPWIPIGIGLAAVSDMLALPGPGFPAAAVGATLGYIGMDLVARVGRGLFRREALGQGDVHLMAAIGAWLGPWPALPVVLFGASLVGSIVGIGVIAARGRNRPAHLPFGPMLCLAAVVHWLFPGRAGRLVSGW
jgi:leader peptidase (prepilin peptidase)/N-methyltransferase